jgi:hypothetical protein
MGARQRGEKAKWGNDEEGFYQGYYRMDGLDLKANFSGSGEFRN